MPEGSNRQKRPLQTIDYCLLCSNFEECLRHVSIQEMESTLQVTNLHEYKGL